MKGKTNDETDKYVTAKNALKKTHIFGLDSHRASHFYITLGGYGNVAFCGGVFCGGL